MPLKVQKFLNKLRQSNYDEEEVLFLQQGFTDGFDIGYQGTEQRQSTSCNLPLTVRSKTELWNKLMKQVKLKRIAGPYSKVPFSNFIQSQIGLVPKDNGQMRLIFHLSYDFKSDGLGSVNSHTDKERCSVKYRDLDYTVRAYINLFNQGQEPYQFSMNFNPWRSLGQKWRSQFRILGLSRDSWKWVVMGAQDLMSHIPAFNFVYSLMHPPSHFFRISLLQVYWKS